jgi:diguanylate cyclase (GGDEF)-like protein
MKCPPVLATEPERLKALSAYGLGTDRPLPSLDPVVNIAARMFDMPISAVNMIGSDHVFFAASFGIDDVDMRRDVSFCAHAILQDGVMVVPDATQDERFHDNPLVTGPAHLRFYAGVPILSAKGHALGALCVIDAKPHDFSAEDKERLRELAKMASDRLELQRVEEFARQAAASESQPGEAPSGLQDDELYRLANFDVLTGLANRGRFYRKVEETLLSSSPAAVLMIDLDGFKDVNDTLGHAVGDGILREVATRLKESLEPRVIVARIGGDEFALLSPDVDDVGTATALAQSAIARVAEPILIDGHEVRVSASCGIALAPLHAHEALELIGNADLALFKAKSMGRGRSFAFVHALRMEAAARRLYAIELHRAVADGEFLLFYQPQIRLSDGSLVGAEALIRWHHPTRGILAPGAFLPALEGGPLAATVGGWVLDEACAQAALWRRNGVDTFRIAVNLFSAQFRVGDLVADVLAVLKRHGLPASALELEVTENIAIAHDDFVLETLQRLRAHGVGIAFDDFGTGFGSLSLLKQFPVTRIKIDRSFVQGMLASKRDSSVVQAVLDMARNFELATIAEGVETKDQADYLQALGCEEVQGYFYGKPMPTQQFAEAFGIEMRAAARA